MMSVYIEHEAVVAISNRLFERNPATWRRWLAFAESRGVTLLALIYVALRELRDAAARAAFETGEDFSVITWEWRQAIVAELGCKQPNKPNNGASPMTTRSSAVFLTGDAGIANVGES